ncbi:hypothetical protein [Hugenholtzia roseola]|uniref:hypothetical protein n=1 Tax=Hugenholtzia roseola TaxID=1002 RepID=UPI0003F78DA4|nr:hypothetical protein [Hugenholtzia roseola]
MSTTSNFHSSSNRRWYDKKRFTLLLSFFCFPLGLIPLWMGKSFNLAGKIFISGGLGLLFSIALLSDKNKNTNSLSNNNLNNIENKKLNKNTENNVKIEIISTDFFMNIKASFGVRLPYRVDKTQLEKIANDIKSQHPGYEKYFITYHLPGENAESVAWATTHFDPTLAVKILGLTSEEYEELRNSKVDVKGKIVGKWFIDSGMTSRILIISEDNKNQFIETTRFKDGSISEIKLTKKDNKYLYKNALGEYLKVEEDGRLSLHTSNKLLGTYEKMD